jgi:hypothetical protein
MIILRNFVTKRRAKSYKDPKHTVWKTLGGTFSTKRKALIDFTFPELSMSKKVTWICHVDEKSQSDQVMYDMIIGMDLLVKLGIHVDTESRLIRWEVI